MTYTNKIHTTLYRVKEGKYIECYGNRIHDDAFRIELDSDGESDYTYYYKGNSLRYVKRVDYKFYELEEA